MNRNQDKMENLLANKQYKDLSPDEKEWVGQQYSAEEYNAMHTTLRKGIAIFKTQQTRPNPEIQTRLRHRLKQVKEPAKVYPLFAYRIPAWQAIAAFALLLFFIPQLQEKPVSDPEQIFIYQTDTVFKEIPFQNIINPLVDTLTDIPQVRKILNRTNRAPGKASTVVFSKDSLLSANLSKQVSESFANNYDTVSVENIISRYLKDSVKNYKVAIDSGFQDIGRVY
jgi:hypothetical protein